MKFMSAIITMFLTISLQAQAAGRDQIVGIMQHLDEGGKAQRTYTVTAMVCPFSFPVINEEISRISETEFLVKFTAWSGPCTEPQREMGFIVYLDTLLKNAGVDPQGDYTLYFRLP